MNWSAEQRRLLHALGHELMVHGTVWPAPAIASSTAPARTPASTPAKTSSPASESNPPGRAAAAPAQTARLLEALRRAANGAEVAALAGDLDQLRREPALKRALWPRLRALRRSH